MKGYVSGSDPVSLPDWTGDPAAFDASVRSLSPQTGEGRGPSPQAGEAHILELRDLVLRVRPQPGPDDGLPGVLTGGTVSYDGRSYRITGGDFVALAAGPHGRRLRYRIQAESTTRERIDVAGVKFVTGKPWRWWADTSRMYVVLSTSDGERTCAAGTVRIGLGAFARQLTTFRGRPADIAAFLWRFAGRLMLPGHAV